MQRLSAYVVFLVISGTMAFAQTLIFTVLAVYYVTVVGMNPLQLVLVGTVLEGTIFLLEVPTGVVADTYSRRLSVIIAMFVLGAAYLLEGLVPLFVGVLIAEAIRGVGETFISGALDAWLADEVGEQQVGAVYLRAGQVGRLAGLVAIGVSVALGSIQPFLPVVVGGALFVGLGVFLVLFMPETGFQPTPRDERSSWQSMGQTFRAGLRAVRASTVLTTILAISLVGGAASEGFDRLWEAHFLMTLRFPQFGGLTAVAWFGILAVLGSIAGIITAQLFRRRVDAASRVPAQAARALLVLEALSISSIIVFALAGNFWVGLAAILVKGALGSLARPLYGAWLVQNIDPKVRATVLSFSGQSNAIGQTLGGPGVGAVGAFVSLRAALVAAGLLLAPALWLYALTIRRSAPAAASEAQVAPTEP